MPAYVSVAEAKAQLSELLRQVEAGHEVIITRNGAAVARIASVRPRAAGFMSGEVVVNDDRWWQPDDELAELFGS